MSEESHTEKPGESATTREELDFDDETHESSTTTPAKAAKSPSPKPKVSFAEEETPPVKPPRPSSPQVQAENTLIEAFPDIDAKVVKAVLMASGGKLEPAFNALLGMSDPNFKPEEAPPPRPPRPTQAQRQLEQDEMYARQLADHFNSGGRPRGYDEDDRGPPLPSRNKAGRPTLDDGDREHSFFDDDLPVIKENVRKGFLETQTTVNKWISDFRKRIEGDDDDPYNGPPRMESPQGRRQNFGSSQTEQLYGIRKSSEVRRKSTDKERYDSDPHVLDDDFATLELRDEEASYHRASSSGRPLANPDLFKTNVQPPQSGPVDEVDAADRRMQRQTSPGSATKQAKWQPLTSVTPDPESEENDPFSLGDSDDEKESKTKDQRENDSARLKEAARNSVSAEAGSGPVKELQASERSGSKNAEAEALLTGKS